MQPYVPGGIAWLYPAKTVLTGLLILGVRRWLVPSGDWAAVTATVTGLIVMVLWILPEGIYALGDRSRSVHDGRSRSHRCYG